MNLTNNSIAFYDTDQSENVSFSVLANQTVSTSGTVTMSTSVTLTTNQPNDTAPGDTDGSCRDWQQAQHALFQFANLCMVISFLTPSNFRHHAFFLRFMINFGFLFLILWAGLFICMIDIVLWNIAFLVVNSFHVTYLGYKIFPPRFSKTLDDLYSKTFKPLKVTRKQFKDFSKFGNILLLAKGAVYAKEGTSLCGQKVSMLLKGRLKVTSAGLYLHTIEVNQFVDSLEYDSAKQYEEDNKFQVSISAVEDSLLVSWPYRRLRNQLETDEQLQYIFHQLIGKDISQKLYQIQERLLCNPRYMETLPSRQSSMVNLRNSLVSSSNTNINKLNCFGYDMKGCKFPKDQQSNLSSLGTYETYV